MSEPNLDSVPPTPVTGSPPDATRARAGAEPAEAEPAAEETARELARRVLLQQEGPSGTSSP